MTTTARLVQRAADIAEADWDACAGDANPFTRHAFITALEDSGSATRATGWGAAHLVVDGADGRPAGILPGWLKSHSQGEYVFDHAWADAYERAGGRYYPKLQHAVPFTPATGPRLLLRDPEVAPALIAAAEALVGEAGLSSAHATFLTDADRARFEAAGWLIRAGEQFHWANAGYVSFDDFLAALASRKRKALKKERAEAQAGVDRIVALTGGDLREAHWDAFWAFYQDTGARKWGRPYLTRLFFSLLGERMGERVLLFLAYRGDRPIAGALNLIGDDTLYGRYWGCTEDVPYLHFELCYHQAVDWAIAHGKARVEAGAQGAHKLARGYLPVPVWSAHHIAHPGLRHAVADYLDRERQAVMGEIGALGDYSPFKRGD
ncbi:MAG: N-acetyltransferase [Alphaproteobacteria bacterium]|nr:N-acetyltransferase [Alphaproteobacteria bacterium]